MTDNNHTKHSKLSANLSNPKIGQQNAIGDSFNKDNKLERRIAQASPETQEKIRFLQKVGERSVSDLKRFQANVHQEKILRRENELVQKYFNENANRLIDPEAQKADLKIIKQQAIKQVMNRDDWHVDNRIRAVESNVWACLSMAREEQQLGQTQKEVEPEIEQ